MLKVGKFELFIAKLFGKRVKGLRNKKTVTVAHMFNGRLYLKGKKTGKKKDDKIPGIWSF